MKKILIVTASLFLLISILSACDKKPEEEEITNTTTTEFVDNYSLTQPSYTVGAPETSEKYDTGNGSYEIRHFDADGNPAKCDYYRDGKLAYYSVYSGADEMGNAIQEKYYTADGKFVAIYDNGIFFDESGNKLSENYVTDKLG